MIDDKVSLKDFWGVVTRLKNEAARCLKGWEETPQEEEEARSFWRRMYAHAIFSFFDGVTYRMTFHAHAARFRRDVVFSLDELTRLENAYDFDEDAEPVAAFSKTRMLDDTRFAFNVFARVHYSDYVLPTADPDWVSLREVAHIRNVLQYPREPAEIEVYEENVESLLEGMRWYVERLAELLRDCLTQFELKVAEWDEEEEEGGAIM